MTENNGGRVSTKEFYELQLQIKKELQEYNNNVIVLGEQLKSLVKDKEEKELAAGLRFAAIEKKSKEIDDDLQAHKNVDNWFKGIVGLVQTIILGVQLWWMNNIK